MDVRQRKIPEAVDHEDTVEKGNRENMGNETSIKLFVFLGILISIFAYSYYTSPINAVQIDVAYVPFKGIFAPNDRLTKGTVILDLDGPESVVEDNEKNIYMGLADGRIVQIMPSRKKVEIGEGLVRNLTTTVYGGVSTDERAKTGRPLGLRFKNERLYVADSFYGIYSVNVRSGLITQLVQPIKASPSLKSPDHLTLSQDGKVLYFTDFHQDISTYQHGLIYSLLEGRCTGRVFRYDLTTDSLKVLMSSVCTPSGIELSKDEKSLIISEAVYYRVRIVDLETLETKNLIPLPFMPNNIILNKRDNFWVSGTAVPNFLSRIFNRLPVLRQTICGLIPQNFLFVLQIMLYKMEHSAVMEINDQGEILQVLQSPNGELQIGLTEVRELSDGRLALGSNFAPFLALLDKQDLYV